MESDINQLSFDFCLKVDKLKTTNYDEVYLFLIWESFQDIFGEDDIEFIPTIFGFSIVKIFETDDVKSLESSVVIH